MSTESIEGYVPVNFAKEPEKALVIWTRVNKAKSRVTIEYAARVLIKKKMLELGYAYTGWGPTPGPLIHEWRDWHSHTGLYSGELSEEVTRDVLQYLNDRVKAWSQEFFDIGAFGFGSIGFCVGSHTREMFKNKYIVHVAEWAVDQSLKTDWNGELQASGQAMCKACCIKSLRSSVEDNNFTVEDIAKLDEAWQQIMESMKSQVEV